MSTFVESLRRLYQTEKIEKSKLNILLKSNKSTKEEYDYVLGKEE